MTIPETEITQRSPETSVSTTRHGDRSGPNDNPTITYQKFDQKQQDLAIKHLTEFGPHNGLIAKAAGISRETLRHYLKNDPEFKARWEDARDERNQQLEMEARRRAVEGVTRRKYDKDGRLIEEEQVYSDRLMEKLLESDMPDRFRDRGPFVPQTGGGVLLIPVVGVATGVPSPEDLARRLEELTESQRVMQEDGEKIMEGSPVVREE